jgi:hypothetical protein
VFFFNRNCLFLQWRAGATSISLVEANSYELVFIFFKNAQQFVKKSGGGDFSILFY